MLKARVCQTSSVFEAIKAAGEKLGYQVRPNQLDIVEKFIQGNDVFVALPTGSGKSLCYWILPWAFDLLRKHESPTCLVVVVSPLIALIKDQVQALMSKGLMAAHVGEVGEDDLHQAIHKGQYQILFFSPESLLRDVVWREMLLSPLYKKNMVGFIVDEAHCVKKWGESFRKEFSLLGEIRSLLDKSVPVMALTATATRKSRRSICRTLGMTRPVTFVQLPNRPNIKYTVHKKSSTCIMEETFAPLVEEVRRLRSAVDRIIVFCRSYNDCTELYLFFKRRLGKECTEPIGAPDLAALRIVDMFNACTHPSVKNCILQKYCDPNSHLRVIIATIAFGMGLNCPNVRRIIHWGVPSDVESYLQETGRAGRDGLQAVATLYYGSHDISGVHVTEEMKDYCSLKDECRRAFLMKDFDGVQESNESVLTECSCCDICSMQCKCIACEEFYC